MLKIFFTKPHHIDIVSAVIDIIEEKFECTTLPLPVEIDGKPVLLFSGRKKRNVNGVTPIDRCWTVSFNLYKHRVSITFMDAPIIARVLRPSVPQNLRQQMDKWVEPSETVSLAS